MTKLKKIEPIKLSKPIIRGDQKIESITLREPKTGELRGLNMVDLVQLQTDALITLVPRISKPILTEEEIAELAPADTFQIAQEIADFLVPGAGTNPYQ